MIAGWRLLALRWAVLIGALGALEAACRFGAIDRLVLLPPTEMLASAVRLVASGKAVPDLLATGRIMAVAIVASLLLGTAGGIALHALPRLKRALAPLLSSYYSVPVFVLYPVLILIFGLNDLPLIIIGALFAVIIMAQNTMNGLDRIPLALDKTARMLRLSAWQRVFHVMLPAAFRYLIVGAKLAVAYCFIGVIAGEFILSTIGMGHAIAFAYNDFDNPAMYGLMTLVVVIATTINLSLHAWEHRVRRRREGA